MPVINFDYYDLIDLLGREVSPEELLEIIPMMGADLHQHDPSTGEMAIEFFPNRPDLYSVEGIARALRSFLGMETLRRYTVKESGITLYRDRSVDEVRPFVVGGVVREVRMTDELIRSLMELQEKLHLTVGRRRAKVSIGIHDMDMVDPPFTYKAVDPRSVRFVPLAKEEEMDLLEILERHEKGREYAFILSDKDRYPLIVDREEQVLSFPPIINGRLTTVTESTRNVFIDVTGTDLRAIEGALNIVAAAMADRGGRLESVAIEGDGSMVTPDLEPREWTVDPDYCRSWLGLSCDNGAICDALGRMGYGSEPLDDGIRVLAPAVRMDLLHEVDLAEDVAIGYGYEKFGTTLPRVQTYGAVRGIERISELVRDIMIGYGYIEASTLMLSSEREQFDAMGLERKDVVEILNPIGEEHTCIRVHLLPSLMGVLRKSKHRDLPQRLFEVGDVVVDAKRRRHLAGVSVHAKASFTEMKSLVEGLMREFTLEFSLEPYRSRMFIPGRAASVIVNDEWAGYFGELHPDVITSMELGHPIVAFELNLDLMLGERASSII